MPFKNPEVRKTYARKYARAYRLRWPQEKISRYLKQQRERKKEIFDSMSSHKKDQFYKNMYVVARKRGQYDNIAEQSYAAYNVLRNKVLIHLGNRCSSPNCQWVNEDGTTGCILRECLQVDHVRGGGNREKEKGSSFLRKVLRDTSGAYQLLCANCNWIKRQRNNEVSVSKYAKVAA